MPPSRRLSAEEAALWRRVVASVRPTRGARVSGAQASGAQIDTKRSLAVISPRHSSAPDSIIRRGSLAAAARVASANPNDATLDGSWDRKLATGRIAPEVTIDLHGCTLDRAHDRLDHGLRRAIGDGARIVLLVTGKAPRAGASRIDLPLRGIIRASVQDWLHAAPFADRIAAIRPAHPRHGGAGALYIIIRRIKN